MKLRSGGTVMKAMQIISSGGFYGAERVVVELAAYLEAAGWESLVVALESPGAQAVVEQARRRGIQAEVLPGVKGKLLLALQALRRYVVDNDINLVHSHGYKSDTLVALARIPTHIGIVATCHTWYSESLKLTLYEWVNKLVLHAFDHVVLVSPQLVEEVFQAGMAVEQVTLVENGITAEATVNRDREAVRAELGVEPHEQLILRVGRLAESKGNDVLLEALALVASSRPVRLVLVGEGEEQEALSARARALGLEHKVDFLGYRQDIADLLGASDLFVISSNKEGLPIVLLEAMRAAVPIVSTAVGAIPLVIRSGYTGQLVPHSDPEALAGALAEALDNEQQTAHRAQLAHKAFLRSYTVESMGSGYLEIYRRVLDRE